MRRDYFTVVFLACVAGSLAFIWANPLYFTYDAVVPRAFGVLEIILSAFYTVFFLLIIPLVTSYYRKPWVCVGLAFYGVMAYLPLIFLPRLTAPGASDGIANVALTYLFRGMYDLLNAPFAGMSNMIGSDAASHLSCWIMPIAIATPLLMKYARFCRQAYITEKLAPSSSDRPQAAARQANVEPEVIGTVISAPAKPKSPEEVERKARDDAKVRIRPSERAHRLVSHDKPASVPEGNKVRQPNITAPEGPAPERVEAPQGPAPEKVAAPESASSPALGAGDVIQLGPGAAFGDVINLGPPPQDN
ncbi:MAG: hypothetical protein J6X33_07000 [Clostridiales bacterium]|nr:hypothetical protein [Clostridiales bacterium]